MNVRMGQIKKKKSFWRISPSYNYKYISDLQYKREKTLRIWYASSEL